MVSFKGAHFVKDLILTCVRWYVAYPLSYRHVEELMQERGVTPDRQTLAEAIDTLERSWGVMCITPRM